MYAHGRSLVKRLDDKPFVLLGVNSDADREAVKSLMVREQITWRSFWNGGGVNGPIASAWGVDSWPRLFVIDHLGKIRTVGVRAEALDRVVDELLREMGTPDSSGP